MAPDPQRLSFGIDRQLGPGDEAPRSPRLAFGLGLLAGVLAGAGLAVLVSLRPATLDPQHATNFVAPTPLLPVTSNTRLSPRRPGGAVPEGVGESPVTLRRARLPYSSYPSKPLAGPLALAGDDSIDVEASVDDSPGWEETADDKKAASAEEATPPSDTAGEAPTSAMEFSSDEPSGVDNIPSDVDPTIRGPQEDEAALKLKLIKLAASYDRGFGASPNARREVDDLISKLEILNPTRTNASRGVEGDDTAPLKGAWRMIWTTALDVLNLAANPVASPGAIYQVIDPPIATNIIDFIPRAQSLLPTGFPNTQLRAEVKTRTSKRSESSNRVGLRFEAVKLNPIEVLGTKTDFLPPLSASLPNAMVQDLVENLPFVDRENVPGYFDVTYLDGDMLIIRQNAPGGYFVSIKVDNFDP